MIHNAFFIDIFFTVKGPGGLYSDQYITVLNEGVVIPLEDHHQGVQTQTQERCQSDREHRVAVHTPAACAARNSLPWPTSVLIGIPVLHRWHSAAAH